MNLMIGIATLALTALLQGAEPMMSQVDIAKRGEGGYLHYRIPNLVSTRKGTVVAVLEGRKTSLSDSSDIDTLVMRSFDSGKTWTRYQVIGDNGVDKIGNPCTLLDRTTGTIWVFLTVYRATLSQKQIIAGEGSIQIWTTKSTDDGAHWSIRLILVPRLKAKTSGSRGSAPAPARAFNFATGVWWHRCIIAGKDRMFHIPWRCTATITASPGCSASPPATTPMKPSLRNYPMARWSTTCAAIWGRTVARLPAAGMAARRGLRRSSIRR